ncbi:orotidine-5'-phosphate decarboxylase [Patescibacteria group bacterium]|nr:orotidine-5'-phosphate decarboxylase [Patescibacteria group bacterium]
MTTRHFGELLAARMEAGFAVCVGLDSDHARLPAVATDVKNVGWRSKGKQMHWFNCHIVDAVADLVVCFKPNVAFYEAHAGGFSALRETIRYIHKRFSDIPVIVDGKRTDIGSTNKGYVQSLFDYLEADAITINPYFGAEAVMPFLEREEKGIFVLCRTSNPGAGEFQDLMVEVDIGKMPLYQVVARRVANNWNERGNCGLVVGATYPEELVRVRQLVGDDIPILVPGVGTQGGSVQEVVAAGKKNLIINSSSAVIFASNGSDFYGAARIVTQELHDKTQAAHAAMA